MSNTSNASKNVKRFLLLFALGIAYGFMYVMPYMKSSFYDQMIAAMGCTNAQLGSLMTAYCICCTVSYLPGGWIGDKFNPKPVLLISIFGQAALSFLFMFTYKSYTMAVIIWLLMGLTGGFAFWPAIMKGIRMTGTDEEQGRMYGIFEALNGLASLLLSFIMIGVMAVVGGSDLITGFKSALAFMGGLSIVSGILVAILMPKDAAYGVSDEEKENQIAKLDVTPVPYQFAVQDGNDNSYYIVMDEDYMYVAYMPTSTFNSLNREDISENPGKIEGMTKLATREIKELAVEAYNDAIEDENYKITVADYDNYFGSVYLDASEDALLDVGSLQMTGCMICLIIGLASLLTGIIKKVHFNISVKKMDEDLIEKLDNEMNDTDAFYYEKTHLYLTKNYIINFQGRFKVIEYRDVIWMYAMNYRTNGIKTRQTTRKKNS